MGRKDGGATHFADLVPGAAHPLHGGRDCGWRLHEHDLIESADIDPHFQRICSDYGLEFAGLELSLHLFPDFTGERPVVGVSHEGFFAVITLQGKLLAECAIIRKEEGGAVGVDNLLELFHKGVPNRILAFFFSGRYRESAP